ncbi:hypothetical protein ACJX0J_020783 [Zea mays]
MATSEDKVELQEIDGGGNPTQQEQIQGAGQQETEEEQRQSVAAGARAQQRGQKRSRSDIVSPEGGPEVAERMMVAQTAASGVGVDGDIFDVNFICCLILLLIIVFVAFTSTEGTENIKNGNGLRLLMKMAQVKSHDMENLENKYPIDIMLNRENKE